MQIIPDKENAADVLQEVFVKIYQKIKLYDSNKGRLYTWMFQIARNKAIDTFHSKGYKENYKTQSLNNPVYKDEANTSVSTKIDAIGLDKVLDALEDSHKDVIYLGYYKGYTQKEMAEELDIPLGTVKTRVRNALTELRRILKVSQE